MGYEKIDENIRLYVRDTGIGIPEDKKIKYFIVLRNWMNLHRNQLGLSIL